MTYRGAPAAEDVDSLLMFFHRDHTDARLRRALYAYAKEPAYKRREAFYRAAPDSATPHCRRMFHADALPIRPRAREYRPYYAHAKECHHYRGQGIECCRVSAVRKRRQAPT